MISRSFVYFKCRESFLLNNINPGRYVLKLDGEAFNGTRKFAADSKWKQVT